MSQCDPTIKMYGVADFAFIPKGMRLGHITDVQARRTLKAWPPVPNGAVRDEQCRTADVAAARRAQLAAIGVTECEYLVALDDEVFTLGSITAVDFAMKIGILNSAWMHEAMRRGTLHPRPPAPREVWFYCEPECET